MLYFGGGSGLYSSSPVASLLASASGCFWYPTIPSNNVDVPLDPPGDEEPVGEPLSHWEGDGGWLNCWSSSSSVRLREGEFESVRGTVTNCELSSDLGSASIIVLVDLESVDVGLEGNRRA